MMTPKCNKELMGMVDRSLKVYEDARDSKDMPYTHYLFNRMLGRTNVTLKEFLKNVRPKG